ncbi:MAG: haloacid dehalogenase-like hydrolase [Nitrosopumilales archaeon]|nr:MAG: haloacid dehalogenase-like hydrolase [Nitrosopumilales archaeon]
MHLNGLKQTYFFQPNFLKLQSKQKKIKLDTRYQLKPYTLLFSITLSLLIFTLSFIISILFIVQPISAQTNLSSSSLSANQTQDILDPLPSWKDVTVKHNIIEFVQNVTDSENTDYYISPEDRIAVFDNDGTLWSEKPIPFQGYFSIDRVPTVVAKNPELKNISPFKEILANNLTALKDMTEKEAMDLIVTTHSNISEIEFNNLVKKWAQNATHPETKRLFVDMVYQPMLELLHFLNTNQFKEFIVSGGGVDFMREALSSVYEIPKDQIIGSSLKYKFVDEINNTNNDINNNKSFIFREPVLVSFDNTYEKPANIALHIGKVPVIVAGNSDGDLQMLEYADDNNPKGKSLKILIHHDDPIREFSYDKGAEKVLEESKKRNWNIVSMKDDFTTIFPSVGNETSDVSK